MSQHSGMAAPPSGIASLIPARIRNILAPESGHLRELDGIRAFSIMLVLAAHLLPLTFTGWELNESAGIAGMSLFFSLSGFLIASILWKRPQVKPFLIRRVARIAPLMYLYAVVVALVVYWRPDTFLAILTFTLNYNDPQIYKGVSHLWSLCVEMHFYLGIALAVGLFGRKGFWIVPIAAVAVTGLRIEDGAVASIRTHHRIDEILTGALLGLWWANRGTPALQGAVWQGIETWVRRLLPLLFVLWLLACYPPARPLPYFRPYITMLMVSGVMLQASDGRLKQFLSTAPLGFIARISYALYIWHPLMALGPMSQGSAPVRYLIKRPITFLLTFIAATLSTAYYEKIFTDWARRLTGQSRRQ
ncbi:acyltransferase family protein [Paenirhodobacter populi]|uniref:Acyltransferase n=1 Tax=Paenirhodobacter populi TaxID=2306993 RepID=A0A443IP19_9RHOB|nr:acyltransferase [Sinirhodobacter populi]RWR08125.1 acyltransferase [Sinirhodobacter populi]